MLFRVLVRGAIPKDSMICSTPCEQSLLHEMAYQPVRSAKCRTMTFWGKTTIMSVHLECSATGIVDWLLSGLDTNNLQFWTGLICKGVRQNCTTVDFTMQESNVDEIVQY